MCVYVCTYMNMTRYVGKCTFNASVYARVRVLLYTQKRPTTATKETHYLLTTTDCYYHT